jgi:HNH endonuclease
MTHTADSFWGKVKRAGPDDCWNWDGWSSSNRKGERTYGRIDIFGAEGVFSHRVAYFLTYPGEIALKRPDGGLFVLHKCDNPQCCNPKHLCLGTHDENMYDMHVRRRSHRYESAKSPRAKLTEAEVREIRRLKKTGVTKRALALLYDVSEATISGCCYGRHYRDVI